MTTSTAPSAASSTLDEASFQKLRHDVRGQLIQPADPEYGDARLVWNGMIDRHPALIVRCTGVADVLASLRFARSQNLTVAVRGGGHNVAGFATCDDGLVIDLGPMKGVQVDTREQTVRAQAGLTWGELDHETLAFGLATTGGLVTTTGIAGFTLGGGIGWLMRKHGLTSDNLLSADMVTADGRFVTASATDNPELFWGLRGGGGNFGIVTSFQYRLHRVGPIVLGGALFYSADLAADLLRFYRNWTRSLPDELTTLLAFLTAPPEPFIPAALVGKPMVGVALCYTGAFEDGHALLKPLLDFAQPAVNVVHPIPYTILQGMFDASAPRGIRSYWKTAYLDELTDPAIASIVESGARMSTLSPFAAIHLHHAEGAVAEPSAAESAFGRRDARFILNFPACWSDAIQDEAHMSWVRESYAAVQPHSGEGAYLNFLAADDTDRVRIAYGPERYARLSALKAQYDPDNVFHLNQNVKPA